MVEETKTNQPSEIDVLRGQLAEKEKAIVEAQKQAAEALEQAKIHQRGSSKKDEELRKAQESASEIKGLRGEVKLLAEMIADLVGSGEGNEETEGKPAKKTSEYLKKFEDADKARQTQELESIKQSFAEKAQEAEKLASSVGMDVRTAPELARVRRFFQLQDPDEGLELMKEIVASKKPKEEKKDMPEETKEQLIERIKKETREQVLKESGINRPEGGTPASGVGTSDADWFDKFGRGEIPSTPENLKKAKEIQYKMIH